MRRVLAWPKVNICHDVSAPPIHVNTPTSKRGALEHVVLFLCISYYAEFTQVGYGNRTLHGTLVSFEVYYAHSDFQKSAKQLTYLPTDTGMSPFLMPYNIL